MGVARKCLCRSRIFKYFLVVILGSVIYCIYMLKF